LIRRYAAKHGGFEVATCEAMYASNSGRDDGYLLAG
jgi:hypothetical protein